MEDAFITLSFSVVYNLTLSALYKVFYKTILCLLGIYMYKVNSFSPSAISASVNVVSIGSDNGLSPNRHQATI